MWYGGDNNYTPKLHWYECVESGLGVSGLLRVDTKSYDALVEDGTEMYSHSNVQRVAFPDICVRFSI
jgi:hypothetical protein